MVTTRVELATWMLLVDITINIREQSKLTLAFTGHTEGTDILAPPMIGQWKLKIRKLTTYALTNCNNY